MPKPIFGQNGSGMHVHQSLYKGDNNAFFDPNGEWEGISDIMTWYVGGLLDHARGLVAITNPIVNSYKRLVPGYEAPTHLAWSMKNRSPLIRVPATRGEGTRCELRMPDPSCNPYLAFTSMLAAGIDGVKNQTEPPLPITGNVYKPWCNPANSGLCIDCMLASACAMAGVVWFAATTRRYCMGHMLCGTTCCSGLLQLAVSIMLDQNIFDLHPRDHLL